MVVATIKVDPDTELADPLNPKVELPTTPPRRTTPRKRKTQPSPIKQTKDTKEKEEIEDIESMITPPRNWQHQYDTLKRQRERGPVAPVDTMGCDTHHHADPKTARFHALISLMLSSQCKDTQNAITMADLKRHLPRGLTLEDVLEVEESVLRDLIRGCGLQNRKAMYIKRAALVLRDSFAGDVPRTIEGCLSLPGVGPKMGFLLLGAAWELSVGIGVDTHVHRISNLLEWVRTKNPEETRKALELWLPKELWREVNHLMVGHGQTICLPRGRMCDRCDLAQAGCPSIVQSSPRKRIKVKTEVTASPVAIKYETEVQTEVELSPYFPNPALKEEE